MASATTGLHISCLKINLVFGREAFWPNAPSSTSFSPTSAPHVGRSGCDPLLQDQHPQRDARLEPFAVLSVPLEAPMQLALLDLPALHRRQQLKANRATRLHQSQPLCRVNRTADLDQPARFSLDEVDHALTLSHFPPIGLPNCALMDSAKLRLYYPGLALIAEHLAKSTQNERGRPPKRTALPPMKRPVSPPSRTS